MTSLSRDENRVPIQSSDTSEQSAIGTNSTTTALGSAADIDGTAGFSAVLVTNAG